MKPETNTVIDLKASVKAQEAELLKLAHIIEGYKNEHDLTWKKLTEVLPEIGSQKTLSKICRGDFSELDPAKWLASYRSAAARINADEEEADELVDKPQTVTLPILENLTPTLKLRQMFTRLRHSEGENCRLGVLCMDGGGGKTTAAKALQARWKNQVLRIECLVVWDDKPSCMLFDICAALGVKDIPTSRHARYGSARDRLNEGKTRKCLIFDEAHYMGPNCLSALVALLNETPGEFIFLCKPLLWKKLERVAFEACDQLKVNRLQEIIKYESLPEADYLKFLIARLPHLDSDTLAEATREISSQARQCGHLAFARDVVKRAKELAKAADVTSEHLSTAAEDVARRLGR